MMTLDAAKKKLSELVGNFDNDGSCMEAWDVVELHLTQKKPLREDWDRAFPAGTFDHLSQPQPVAQGEAAGFQDIRARIACDSESEWFVSLVHCGHTVRTAKTFPNREGAEGYLKGINLWLEGGDSPTRTIPTGHRVVPEQPLEAADERAAFERWVRSHFKYPNLDIDTRYPGYYADKMTAGAWEAWQERAASPSAGGV